MFTGIVHHQLGVADVRDHAGGRRLSLISPWQNHVMGESIAINGVCLTVAGIGDDRIDFDVIPETLTKTNLGDLVTGDRVHAERSVRVGDPVDGHFVQGHVDGVGRVVAPPAAENQWRLCVALEDALARYLIPRGSIAIDGVSLTLARVTGREFEVALIPTTLELTHLGQRNAGSRLNIECDMMAKTVISYLERIRPLADHH